MIKSFVLLTLLLAVSSLALAQDEPSIHGTKKADVIFQDNGVAIHGYDAVAYFTQNKPVKGKKEFEFEYMGARWRFANAENKDAFMKEPAKYAPQYGGYCAYGMSHGYAAPTKADAWTIVNGKLYLNYNVDIRKEWNKDQSAFISQADQNWPKIPKKTSE
jgi:YHS domain-containing protein